MPKIALAVVFVASVACQARSAGPAPVEPVPYVDTDALPLRAEVARLVVNLAKFDRIESSHIGYAGAPSASWAAFDALRRAANAQELKALLGHRHPVVRGYVAQTLAQAVALSAAELVALARDTTPVGRTDGCERGDSTVGQGVFDALCWNAPTGPVVMQALQLLAAGDGEFARQAPGCIARRKKP